jgi:ABC-type glycerol-3-phosphate transport system permease component
MSSINKKRSRNPFQKIEISEGVLYIFLFLFAMIVVFPYLWMFFTSFKPSAEIFTHEMRLLPRNWQLDNYLQVLQQGSFLKSILNSIVVTIFGVIFEVTIAFMGAYAFAKLDFYGKDFLFMLILGTLMIPPQVLMLPSFIVISDLGWLNTYKGLIFPRAGAAFGIFLLRQFMLTVPKDLDDAARVDGANILQIMFGIYLPICLPSVVTVSVFSMLGFWNDYYWPLVITSDSKMRTVALGIAQFKNLEGMGNWELLMAASMLATLPMLIVFIFARKTLIDNLTAGAVKG